MPILINQSLSQLLFLIVDFSSSFHLPHQSGEAKRWNFSLFVQEITVQEKFHEMCFQRLFAFVTFLKSPSTTCEDTDTKLRINILYTNYNYQNSPIHCQMFSWCFIEGKYISRFYLWLIKDNLKHQIPSTYRLLLPSLLNLCLL